MSSSSSKKRPELSCPDTPPVRKKTSTDEDEDIYPDKFQAEWDAFVARHHAYEEKLNKDSNNVRKRDDDGHRIDPETWERHKSRQQENYRKRQKKKDARQDSRKKVTTLK